MQRPGLFSKISVGPVRPSVRRVWDDRPVRPDGVLTKQSQQTTPALRATPVGATHPGWGEAAAAGPRKVTPDEFGGALSAGGVRSRGPRVGVDFTRCLKNWGTYVGTYLRTFASDAFGSRKKTFGRDPLRPGPV